MDRQNPRDLFDVMELFAHGGITPGVKRLCPLDDLLSYDSRYKTAEQDIWQHRVNNSDWPADWIFSDDRFGLVDGEGGSPHWTISATGSSWA